MKFTKNELITNTIKTHTKSFILISLLCLVFFININPITSLEQNINKNDSTQEKIYQTLKTDNSEKEELEKRRKLKACELLIKVRLAQDIENVKDFILNLIESYSVPKEDAFTKLNSFLSLSCLYNIIPENIEAIENSKSLLDIDSMNPELVKVLELEEWFELHKKLDTVRLHEKINFLRTHFNKYKNNNKEEEVENKGLRIFGFDIFSISYQAKLTIMLVVLIVLMSLFLYLFSLVNKERRIKRKKNN